MKGKLIVFILIILSVLVAYFLFSPPSHHHGTTHRPLFEGITYFKEVRFTPRPLVIHVVTVDLTHRGLAFLVTPGEKSQQGEITAHTTSYFLERFSLQLAINGSFFYPFHSHSPWDYFPHEGDSVNVVGLASSRGHIYSEASEKFNTLYISVDNKISFTRPNSPIYHAISGREFLLVQGKFPCYLIPEPPYPRTAMGLNQTATMLILVVVDGKQPGYSEGVTLPELAQIIRAYGGYTALNFDGGGSSTIVIANRQGKSIPLNSPIHTRIPGRERPIANHLGIYARFLPN